VKQNYHSLQILRALAAWMVVYHHFMQTFYSFKSESSLGYFFSFYGDFGVDVFFVLSGFVMYLSVQSTKVSGKKFLINRTFRILPAYWFYSLLFLILTTLSIVETRSEFTMLSLVKSLLFIPHDNPSIKLGSYPFLTVGWTLNFEMVFYVILSASLMASKKHALKLCSVFIFISPMITWSENFVFGHILANHSLYKFLAGLGIGYIITTPLFKYMLNYRLGLCCISFILSIYTFSIFEDFRGLKIVSASSFVFTAIVLNYYINPENRLVKFLVRLGDYSYSTYLLHVILLGGVVHFVGNELNDIEEIAVLLLLTVSLYYSSKTSYLYVENNKLIEHSKRILLSVKNIA